jgi:plastocyanin
MKKLIIIASIILAPYAAKSTIHEIKLWDGYMQFLPSSLEIQLGDTIQWLPLDFPTMVHTITSTNIPSGAAGFDEIWQAPADTFFQYVPSVVGLYEYVCTPHLQVGMTGSFNVTAGNAGNPHELNETEVSLYPNPARNTIYLASSETSLNYSMYSNNGTIMNSGQTNGIIDISHFKNGIYYLKITGDRPRILKFTKID